MQRSLCGHAERQHKRAAAELAAREGDGDDAVGRADIRGGSGSVGVGRGSVAMTGLPATAAASDDASACASSDGRV